MVVDDGLLWQEIYSLREKLKIAVAAIKSYDPDFDDREFTHRLNAVDYDQLMEELADEGAKNTEQQVQPDNGGMCTRPDMVDCHAKVGTGGRCMNVVPCPPLQVN